eukprot:COSAG01_NODE_7635_length_3119_cov_1.967550_6_plen_89_part_00
MTAAVHATRGARAMRRRVHVATRHAEADDSTCFRSRKMRQWTLDQPCSGSGQEKNRSVQGPACSRLLPTRMPTRATAVLVRTYGTAVA